MPVFLGFAYATRCSWCHLRLTRRLLARLHNQMPATVLLIAGFGMLLARRTLFPIRDDGQAVRADAEFHEIVAHGLGALFAEHQIVRRGAALVAMAFDFYDGSGV